MKSSCQCQHQQLFPFVLDISELAIWKDEYLSSEISLKLQIVQVALEISIICPESKEA